MVDKMLDSGDVAPQSPWAKSTGTVEEMRSGNLQFYVPNVVENMQSGGLQQRFAENMKSGGLQIYDSYGDKEMLPLQAQDKNINPDTRWKVYSVSRRTCWSLAIILALIIIGGAVAGGVVGTQKRQSATSANAATTSSSSTISSTQLAESSVVAASSTGSTNTVPTTYTTAPNTTVSSSTHTATTTALPFISPSRANPVDTDGNYFVNCNSTQGGLASGMAYYKNLVPGSNVGQGPDDYASVTNGSYVTWENGGTVKFSTGVPMHWSTLNDVGINQRVGTGDNTYENFFVYQDAGSFLYLAAGNWSCYSMYWAF